MLRYQVQGRQHDLGLGAYPDVSLAMARHRATDARRLIADGDDPIVKRQQAKPKTFKDAALIQRGGEGIWTICCLSPQKFARLSITQRGLTTKLPPFCTTFQDGQAWLPARLESQP